MLNFSVFPCKNNSIYKLKRMVPTMINSGITSGSPAVMDWILSWSREMLSKNGIDEIRVFGLNNALLGYFLNPSSPLESP